MKIEIYSDYACPFCYIGKTQLEQALAKFEHADDVEVVFKAFELYPQMTKEVTSTTQGRIEVKYGKSPAGAMEMIRGIERMAAMTGLEMNYENVQNTNTFDAHRLTQFAASKGKGYEMNDRLMRAYFSDNLPLADHNNLLNLAEEVGLDRAEVAAMLASDDFAQAVKNDENNAMRMGVNSVPFFLIDGEIAVGGSKPSSEFLHILEQVWAKNQQEKNLQGATCDINGCDI